jgi:hypothetical protein
MKIFFDKKPKDFNEQRTFLKCIEVLNIYLDVSFY